MLFLKKYKIRKFGFLERASKFKVFRRCNRFEAMCRFVKSFTTGRIGSRQRRCTAAIKNFKKSARMKKNAQKNAAAASCASSSALLSAAGTVQGYPWQATDTAATVTVANAAQAGAHCRTQQSQQRTGLISGLSLSSGSLRHSTASTIAFSPPESAPDSPDSAPETPPPLMVCPPQWTWEYRNTRSRT